jgi:plasmid stability protein
MKTIQIRHVPDSVHRTLKSRASLAGMSLSDYLLAQLRRTAEQPTEDEVFGRLEARHRDALPVPAAELVRAGRARL